ncbi:hypothetical protein [Bradyrhizobium sp. UNPA324]|uniref:hypothetical protein n=1 Tax=Bradyrhizobium sp. UNPA324 TaxID=1141174 RepID=UPI0011734087|nr:hypothetical protein [Bradyrhizobium sp. UNPA324]TQF28785.1 hypothetical protein UNPA324_03305 [Bradyrhizobium sp. UNPA324]
MMSVLGQMSPAGSAALGAGYGGSALQDQARGEIEEVRRKRMQAAKDAGYSPAGQALAIDFGAMSVPGAVA